MNHRAHLEGPSSPPEVVSSDSELGTLLHLLSAQPVIAVDTESNSFYAYQERICLIQLSIPDTDAIVDPLADLDMRPLGELFADPHVQKVFHAAEQDVAGMKRDFGFQFANLFDTMRAARILGWPRVGLADVLEETFGVKMDKRYQRHDWGKRPLAEEALAYARLDTHYLLPLRDLQAEALEEMGRAEEAAEVFDQLTRIPPATSPFGPEAFWRVKGVHTLDTQEQAVLWELYLWRDRVAKRHDRTPFRVMSNQALVALARAQPCTLEELAQVSRVPPTVARRYGQALLGAVARGREGTAPKPPEHRRHKEEVQQRYQALRTWRRRVAARRRVDADIVLSNNTLWALAKYNPITLQDLESVAGLGPWKRNTYGPDILRILHPEPTN